MRCNLRTKINLILNHDFKKNCLFLLTWWPIETLRSNSENRLIDQIVLWTIKLWRYSEARCFLLRDANSCETGMHYISSAYRHSQRLLHTVNEGSRGGIHWGISCCHVGYLDDINYVNYLVVIACTQNQIWVRTIRYDRLIDLYNSIVKSVLLYGSECC